MTFRDSQDELEQSGRRGFPRTHWEALRGIRSPDDPRFEACWSDLYRTYHPVAYVYFRRQRVPHPTAKDLAADFFCRALENGWFQRAEPERGRFRNLLRQVLHRFWVDDVRRLARRSRAVGVALARTHVSDWDGLEQIVSADLSVGAALDRAEAQGVIDEGWRLAESRAAGTSREVQFRVLRRWIEAEETGTSLTYEGLAEELGLTKTQVTNHLHRARRLLQDSIKEVIFQAVQAADDVKRTAMVDELYHEYLKALRA